MYKNVLIETNRQWLGLFVVVVFIFLINIYIEYNKFKEIKSNKIYTTKALVVKQYTKIKNSKEYFVLKLKSEDGYIFYTTNKEDLKNLRGRYLQLSFLTSNIKFIDFLKTFYAITFNIRLLKNKNIKSHIVSFIQKQHTNKDMADIYSTLFMASGFKKNVANTLNYFGISHLFAISGFHLAFILAFMMVVLYNIYSPIHERFFATRSKKIDLSILCFIILAFYLYIIDFTPSFTRAYVMYVIMTILYFKGIKLLSFTNLIVAILLILAFNPRFMFSIGFYFSSFGVLYIYLFLHYFKNLSKISIYIFLNIWIFIAMLPIIHYFFPIFTPYQLLSIIITMFFPLFYSIEIIFHIFFIGDLFDKYLILVLDFFPFYITYNTDTVLFLIYNILSILSIFYKIVFIFLNIFMILFFIYLVFVYLNFLPNSLFL